VRQSCGYHKTHENVGVGGGEGGPSRGGKTYPPPLILAKNGKWIVYCCGEFCGGSLENRRSYSQIFHNFLLLCIVIMTFDTVLDTKHEKCALSAQKRAL